MCEHVQGSTAQRMHACMPHTRIANTHAAARCVLPFPTSGDTCGGEQPTDPQRRRARSETNTAQRRAFLSSGALLGHRALRRLLLWDKVRAHPACCATGCCAAAASVARACGNQWMAVP